MRRRLKIIGFIAGGFLLLLLVLSLCVTLFFQPQLRALFQKELNKQLTGRIELGDGSISMFRHFPNASMTFTDVAVYSDRSETPDTLLQAGKVSFFFNPFSLISGNYRVKRMALEDASIDLLVDEHGKANYEIWTTDTTASVSNSEFNLSIRKAQFRNVQIGYHNLDEGQNFQIQLADLELGGDFSSTDFRLSTKGDLELTRIFTGETEYAAELPVSMDWQIDVQTKPGYFKMDRGRTLIAEDLYELKGEASENGKGWETDLTLDGQDVSIKSLIALLPGSYREQWKGFDSEGALNFAASAKGLAEPGKMPHIEVMFSLDEGTITHPDMRDRLTKVTLEGQFTNGDKNSLATSRLWIEPFTAQLGSGYIECKLGLDDLLDPSIDLFLDADVDLKSLGKLAEWDELEDLEGLIEVRQLALKGQINDMIRSRSWHRMQSAGKITFKELTADYRGEPLALEHGFLELNRNQILVRDLQLKAGESDMLIEGKSSNVLSYLAGSLTGEEDPVFDLDAQLTAQNLDIEELIDIFGAKEPRESEAMENPPAQNRSMQFLQALRGSLEVEVSRFSAYTFQASDVGFSVRLSPYLTRMKELHASTSEGTIEGDAMLRFMDREPMVEGSLFLDDLNVQQLFTEFGNFWQDFIVDDNLSGTADAKIQFFLRWDEQLNFLTDKMDIRGDLAIRDGELVDFEPLNQLSSYVKVKELEHIQFSTLKNTVIIRNSEVILPAMAIKSTALNLWVSGTHSFDDQIDYQLKIDMMDVLARKIKLGKMKLERAEQKGEGMFNAYVTMTGDVNDPVFETDKAAVLNAFQESRKYLDPEFIDFEGLDPEGTAEQKNRPAAKQYTDTDLEFIDW